MFLFFQDYGDLLHFQYVVLLWYFLLILRIIENNSRTNLIHLYNNNVRFYYNHFSYNNL